MECEHESAVVREIKADACVRREVGEGFSDDALRLRRGVVLGVWVSRDGARIGKRAAAGWQKTPHVLESYREGSCGAGEAADCGDNPFKSDGKD